MVQETKNKHTGTNKEKHVKESARRELLAKYLYDVSKVFVAGLVIINIMPVLNGESVMPNITSITMGTLASIGFAWMANRIMIY